MLIFLHQKACWILLLHMRPSSCKMYEEHAWFESLLVSLVKASNFLGESIYRMLWKHDEFIFYECRPEHDVAHAVLFTHLMFVGRVCRMILHDTVEEAMSSRCRTCEEGASVQLETMVCQTRRSKDKSRKFEEIE
jgi:hypothetical protein